MAAQGRDIKLALPIIEGNRNFATKLWNASRFAEMNECVRQKNFDPKGVKETVNRWIAGETERRVPRGLEQARGGCRAGDVRRRLVRSAERSLLGAHGRRGDLAAAAVLDHPGNDMRVMMLDADQRFRAEGMKPEDAMIHAGERRLLQRKRADLSEPSQPRTTR